MSRKSTFTLSKSTKKIDETIDDDVRNVSTALETLRWIPDNEKADCTSCHKEFSVTVRRHHCRACGEIFCHDCSSMCVIIPRGRIISKNMRFPTDDWKTPLRTCTNCAVSLGHKPPPTLGAQLYVDGSLPTEIPMVNRRWVPDKEQGKCIGCDRSFSLIRRRHHCRACGLIFCNDCSSDKCLIPRQLIIAPNEKALAQIDVALGHRLRTCHRCARALENVQEDLRAIDPKAELSYQRRAFQTTAPVKEKKKKKPPTTTITSNSDDDDVKKPSLTSANGTKGKNGVKTTTANKNGTNSNASKKKPKNTASISSTVGGGGVSSSSSVGGLITAGRKVSFDETSMFSASPSVLSAQTAPPTFHRHSPFQVIEPMGASSLSHRRGSYTPGGGGGGRTDDNYNDTSKGGEDGTSGGGGTVPSRVELLRKRYRDTANSLSKSASVISKSASKVSDTITDRLVSIREGLGKGMSIRNAIR